MRSEALRSLIGMIRARCWLTVDELPDWIKYCVENSDAKAYQNKPIENWDDNCVLVGLDRENGEDVEQVEESTTAMDVENEGDFSSKEVPTSSGSIKKLKRDRLADAVTSFAETFRQYATARQAIFQPAPAPA